MAVKVKPVRPRSEYGWHVSASQNCIEGLPEFTNLALANGVDANAEFELPPGFYSRIDGGPERHSLFMPGGVRRAVHQPATCRLLHNAGRDAVPAGCGAPGL